MPPLPGLGTDISVILYHQSCIDVQGLGGLADVVGIELSFPLRSREAVERSMPMSFPHVVALILMEGSPVDSVVQ